MQYASPTDRLRIDDKFATMDHTMWPLLRQYVIPHDSNNWRAKSLHPRFLVLYIVLLLVVQLRFGHDGVSGDVLGYATNISAERLLELVNAEREKVKLAPLALSSELQQAASRKVNDMFAKNYWAHISPIGETPWAFITQEGYQYIYAGENLAKSFNTSEEVVAAWMNSPSHRANILKTEYRDIGFAIMNGKLRGEDTTLVVQEFGSRTANTQVAQAQPRNPSPAPPEIAFAQETQPTAVAPTPTGTIMTAGIRAGQPPGSPTSQSVSQMRLFPFGINKTISLIAAESFLLLLCLDALYIWRHRAVRVTGHTLSHIIFFLALIGAMGAAGVGVIL